MATNRLDEALKRVDANKRAFLKGLVAGGAFVTPMVLSFPMDAVSVYKAHAQGGSNIIITSGTTTVTTTRTIVSDRNRKEGFAGVDSRAILERVARLPIETWQYKGEAIRHIGPMAQDFAAAFQVGADNRHIDLIDANGVALAAIQALTERLEAQETELAALKTTIEHLQESRAAVLS